MYYQWDQSHFDVGFVPNENREVLVYEVSLNCYLESLFSYCKVQWSIEGQSIWPKPKFFTIRPLALAAKVLF